MPIDHPTAPNPSVPFVFYLGPFRFDSEIDIPELRSSTGSGERAVSIRLGDVPLSLKGATIIDPYCQLTPSEFLLNIPDTARYYVRDGTHVRVDIVPGAPIANVSTYLLGSVFGTLCHQNGLLPLHASAVAHGNAVTAFLGDSGAGKSTLAACLQRRGHRIVSDDICLLDAAPPSGPIPVIPVAGWLKLWNQSLQHLGETPDEQHRVYSTDDKYRLFLPNNSADCASARPRLTRAIFLERGPGPAAQPTLQPLSPLHAVAGLMEMTYVPYVPALAGHQSRLFQQCARVFRDAQAWRLTVPWDLARIDAVLDLLERDLLHPHDGTAMDAST